MPATLTINNESFDMDLIDKALAAEAADQRATPEEQLAAIGSLRRQLVTLELRLEDATDALKASRQWDLVQGLKEERKTLQKKLDRAIDGTINWAQPTMI